MNLYSKIIGTGSYLPPKRVTNNELADQLAADGIETSDEWIVSRSGISARHYADAGVLSSDLAVIASKRALDAAGLEANAIDLIIVASSTPDYPGGFPSTACVVQRKLEITSGCAAMDVQAVCSGFVYALSVADNFIKSGAYKNVLVIGTEVFSRILDFKDRTTCVLFGDGAGAVVLQASEQPGILASKLHADGSYGDILCMRNSPADAIVQGAFLYMDGQAVFKLAVSLLEKVASEVLAAAGLDSTAVDWLVPHQANIRIMQSTARKLKLPLEKMIATVDQHGNTSAASIPLALDLAVRDGRIKPGHTIMMEAVGGGFTWGAVLARM
ncbi:MAG TPA: beta-ketoacyl-ACP synthase III [Herbaspirillum sp.]|nr:beta-ketoacyl-ACP synthase III [Herbaspirillum sp.]